MKMTKAQRLANALYIGKNKKEGDMCVYASAWTNNKIKGDVKIHRNVSLWMYNRRVAEYQQEAYSVDSLPDRDFMTIYINYDFNTFTSTSKRYINAILERFGYMIKIHTSKGLPMIKGHDKRMYPVFKDGLIIIRDFPCQMRITDNHGEERTNTPIYRDSDPNGLRTQKPWSPERAEG